MEFTRSGTDSPLGMEKSKVIQIMRFLILITLLLSSPAYSANSYSPILNGIKPHSITIIGETHKRPESFQLFQSLINDYLRQHKCLTVALEIASNQQSTIDQVIQGKGTVSDLDIAPMIDHPAFRVLINDLVEIQKHNNCFKIIAVDAGLGLKADRDEWMAKELTKQIEQTPILALLGSLHTLKKVDWNPEIGKNSPYMAEILIAKGYDVQTYPQIWKDRNCNTHSRFIRPDESEATELVTGSLFAVLNASKPTTVSNIIDGVILWECA